MATALDDLPLDQRFLSTLKKWSAKTGRNSIELAVLGKAGQGKSSLINGIIGAKMAEEGDDFDPVTKENDDIRTTKNGIEVVLWDTPGLGMDKAEVSHQRLEEMKRKSRSIDLLLYCIKMDNVRWPEKNERDAVEMITEIFGKQIWLNCQFTLTFGNVVAKLLNGNEKKLEKFEKKVAKFTKRIRDIIQQHAKLTDEEAAQLSVVPVGDPHKTSASEDFCHDLPDGEDWFMNLFESCLHTMQKEAVVPLLQARMGNDNSINPQGMPDPHSNPTATRIDETEDKSLDLDKEKDPEGHDNNAPLAKENDPPHKGLVDHFIKQQVKQQVDKERVEEVVHHEHDRLDQQRDERTIEGTRAHLDQQVDEKRLEEQAPGGNSKADTHLDQQHVNHVQEDTHHDDQKLHQVKFSSYRIIQGLLRKEKKPNLRKCIATYTDARKPEKRRFQGLMEGFVAWLEATYNMEF